MKHLYERAGDPQAPTLVRVPGLDGTAPLFFRQLPRLAQRFHVVAFPLLDDPDCSMDSLVEDPRELIEEVAPGPALLRPARPRLREIATPALFLAADRDRLLPSASEARLMAGAVQRGTLKILEGYGHVCLINEDFGLRAQIEPWLEQAAPDLVRSVENAPRCPGVRE